MYTGDLNMMLPFLAKFVISDLSVVVASPRWQSSATKATKPVASVVGLVSPYREEEKMIDDGERRSIQ